MDISHIRKLLLYGAWSIKPSKDVVEDAAHNVLIRSLSNGGLDNHAAAYWVRAGHNEAVSITRRMDSHCLPIINAVTQHTPSLDFHDSRVLFLKGLYPKETRWLFAYIANPRHRSGVRRARAFRLRAFFRRVFSPKMLEQLRPFANECRWLIGYAQKSKLTSVDQMRATRTRRHLILSVRALRYDTRVDRRVCVNGHNYDTENTGRRKRDGRRYCKKCQRARNGRRRLANRRSLL